MDECSILKWRKRNSYYYSWLNRIYRFVIRPSSRVLHVGCQCGDLLAAVKPAYGVGIDTDPDQIELAKKRFPELNFSTMDPCNPDLNEKFDYVIVSNSIGYWSDIQKVFEKIRPLTT